MANIIEQINQIGVEVEQSLIINDTNQFFKHTILLYSLAENLLKYLVATKLCWDESGKQVDFMNNNKEYTVDFGEIRKRAKEFTFGATIDKAKSLNLISENFKNELHTQRKERNDLIHELYLYQQRNNNELMRAKLLRIKAIVVDLKLIFESLIFDEIGVDIPEVLQTL